MLNKLCSLPHKAKLPYRQKQDPSSTLLYLGPNEEFLLIQLLNHSFIILLVGQLNPFKPLSVDLFTHSLTHPPTHSFTHSYTHSFAHSLTRLLNNSLNHSTIHSFNCHSAATHRSVNPSIHPFTRALFYSIVFRTSASACSFFICWMRSCSMLLRALPSCCALLSASSRSCITLRSCSLLVSARCNC